MTVLRSSPFNLDWGTSVYMKVFASNSYGDSEISLAGNGAVITTTPDAPINLVENTSQRTKSTLGLTWSEGAFNGGATIIDYRVSMAIQGGSFSELASGLTSAEYLATGLTFGTTYEFKVESRNSYGYSAYSSTTSLLCAYIPDPPLTVTTTNTNDQVTVSWDDPIANGYVVHAYRFYVLQSDGVTYTEETTDCDGTDSDVVSNRQCTIALLTLTSSPYSLALGDSVSVKIVSINIYGESTESSAGNGAVIQLVPDSPVNLVNDATTTTDTVIKFTWDEGSSNGGTSVIDYDIYYDQGS